MHTRGSGFRIWRFPPTEVGASPLSTRTTWPRTEGALRWVAEVHPRGSNDVCFWLITTPQYQVDLGGFEPPYERYSRVVNNWKTMYEASRSSLAGVLAERPPESVQPTVDLAE